MQQQMHQPQPQPQSQQQQLREPEYLIVLHDFESRSDDELSMYKGDHILVLETDQGFGDGWFIVCFIFFWFNDYIFLSICLTS